MRHAEIILELLKRRVISWTWLMKDSVVDEEDNTTDYGIAFLSSIDAYVSDSYTLNKNDKTTKVDIIKFGDDSRLHKEVSYEIK